MCPFRQVAPLAPLPCRWHGDAEKLVRALFRVAARNQPAIIFIGEDGRQRIVC